MPSSESPRSDELRQRALLELIKPLAPKAATYALSLGMIAISGYANLPLELKPLVDAAGATGINLLSSWIDRRLQGEEIPADELQTQLSRFIDKNDLAPLLTEGNFYDALRQLVRHQDATNQVQHAEILARLDHLQHENKPTFGMPPRVFVSYARLDGEGFARKLRERLIRTGIPAWQDRAGMEGGYDWWQQITAAIDQVEFMVLLMTPAAMQSATVRKEWRYARQKGVCVYPVKGAPDLDFASLPRWMRDAHFYDIGLDVEHFDQGAEWVKFINDLNTRCEIPHVPFMCEDLPADFVARPTEFEALISQLLDPSREEPVAITAALKGTGGYGKTTLARAICHDERIQQAFDDGILWVTLGETVENLIGKVDDFIYVLSGKRSGVSSLETATSELIKLLEDRDLLIVIDDVWHAADLKPFLQGGKRSARLITTRNMEVLPVEVLQHYVPVDAMNPTEASLLLGAGLTVENEQVVRFTQLAARLGEWALLLKLVNGVLRSRVANRQALTVALDYVDLALTEEGLTVFDARDDKQDRERAVATTLGISIAQLSETDSSRYSELNLFPEDVDIPLGTLEKLWGTTGSLSKFKVEQLCERLANLSLLLRFDRENRTVRLHDVIRAYLVQQAGSTAELHGIFLDSYGMTRWAELLDTEPYLWDWLALHLVEAERIGELQTTVLDLGYLARKTYLKGTAAAEADLNFAERSVKSSVADIGSPLAMLRRQFVNMTHLLKRCVSIDEIKVTLHERLQHLDGLKAVCNRFQSELPLIRFASWHRLPDLPDSALIRALVGHNGFVTNVVFSPDGRLLASSSYDNTIRLWESATGAVLHVLEGHTDPVTSVVFSPDGRLLASASYDSTIRLWDSAAGAVLHVLQGYWGRVTSVVFSPDGRLLASASDDSTIRLWDSAIGAELHILWGHTDTVNSVVFSPDGRLLASASDDSTIRLWESATGAVLHVLEGHSNTTTSAVFSPDGRLLASSSYDNTIRLWESATGAQLHVLEGHSNTTTSVVFSPDGRLLASASDDSTIRLWDSTTGAALGSLRGHTDHVNSVVFSPDGRLLASASDDSTIRLWDSATGAALGSLRGHTDPVYSVVFSPDGRLLASASYDKTVRLWERTIGAELRVLERHTDPVNSVVFSPDGRLLASASDDSTIRLWDSATGAMLGSLRGHTDTVNSVVFSPDGRLLASASYDNTIRLWESATGAVLHVLEGRHIYPVTSVVFSPDGHLLASASYDNTIRLWDSATTAALGSLRGHTDTVNSVVFSPDGRLLASASDDSTIRLWDSATGAVLHVLEGHSNTTTSVVFSPDGRLLASASDDSTIRLWESATGAVLHVLEGHSNTTTSAVFSPDGRLLASASYDKTVRLWEPDNGQHLSTFYADSNLTNCIFHTTSGYIAVAGASGVYWLRVLGLT